MPGYAAMDDLAHDQRAGPRGLVLGVLAAAGSWLVITALVARLRRGR